MLGAKTKTIHNKIQADFPFIEFCVWNSISLDEFTLHHSSKHFTLIEVEKDSAESVYFSLKEQNHKVFFNPDSKMLDQYVFELTNPFIVKHLVSEAPVQKVKKYNTVTLEKILVDLYCDETLFVFYQGKEKQTIFKNAFEKYTLNNNKLLRYAARRGKKEEIGKYLNQITGNK